VTKPVEVPTVCKTCKRDFAPDEVRVVIVRNQVPVEKQHRLADGRWAVELEDGLPLYSIEAHHENCAPPTPNREARTSDVPSDSPAKIP
jgi:hypothetical protein